MRLSRFILFVTATTLIVTLVLIWSAQTRISEHWQSHKTIADASTLKAATDISNVIANIKHNVRLFTVKYHDLIQAAIQDPENINSYMRLQKEISDHFPFSYSYIITRLDGTPINQFFRQNMGPSCEQDIKQFARNDTQSFRVHPSNIHHIDVMHKIRINQVDFIFAINFNTSTLTHSLTHIETPGHNLILTLPDSNNLIELTNAGSRDKMKRVDYHLTANEKSRILSSTIAPNTQWSIVDLPDINLFPAYRKTVLNQTYLVIFILTITMLLMIYLNHLEVKKRQQAENSKNEFLSIVSHELRTPITSINGALSLIANGLTGEINEKTSHTLDIAISNTYRLSLLVNDLLDVQSLESGRMTFVKTVTNPEVFINRVIRNIRDYIIQHNCEYTTMINPCERDIFIDSERIEQVLINLITNAVKFGCRNDRIEIKMSCDNSHITFSITDHGTGIDIHKQEYIFEKFTQSNMKDNRNTSGNGLGLYISKMIVNHHDGIIGFHSTPHKQTIFYVKLPLQDT